MTKEDFQTYIAAFNAKDFEGFGRFYRDDVTLSLSGKRVLRSRDEILSFYRDVAKRCDEKLDLRRIVLDDTGIAVELDTEFKGLVDDPGFIAGPLVTGQSIFITSVIFYTIKDGRFSEILARRVGDARTGPATF
ncbi:hypothetical protein IP68_04405 [Blastomonas sp. AAP25]|uniref:nuclear transport factor 2 family protein n=1 Tax=Blastomonas sp. AAP25 TaxID=1523416 RepID=UPI0006B9FE05|nr:nuclear transport factor 2 family protein [Blastomonas sp. AAP25]KPF76579.1 hypothetical protein IP68_04405 [Blastomonas sp. AAP25]